MSAALRLGGKFFSLKMDTEKNAVFCCSELSLTDWTAGDWMPRFFMSESERSHRP